eukprot:14129885-Ditylum_brightwellii.AAC.2
MVTSMPAKSSGDLVVASRGHAVGKMVLPVVCLVPIIAVSPMQPSLQKKGAVEVVVAIDVYGGTTWAGEGGQMKQGPRFMAQCNSKEWWGEAMHFYRIV